MMGTGQFPGKHRTISWKGEDNFLERIGQFPEKDRTIY